MKGYLLRLICAAFVCAIVDAIAGEPGQKTRRMASGLFLLVTALSFPQDLELPDFQFERILQEAQAVADAGKLQSVDAQTAIITDGYRAYILTEAAALGLEVEVSITLWDDLTPRSVSLSGIAAPAERLALRQAVARGLGLGEEDVIWKGLHQSSE